MNQKIRTERFDNGVSCVVIDMPHLNSVSVDVFVRMGSLYEVGSDAGMAHFLEHMAFKGTEKRKSSYEINKEIDNHGGEVDASTSFELTNYRIRTVPANLSWAIEFLSDIVLNSTVPGAEVAKEKGVVVEEIKMYKDNPIMGASFDFIELLYGESHRGCWSISGSENNVRSFNQKDLVSYRDGYLKSGNVVVVLTGNIKNGQNDIDDMMRIVSEKFKGLENGLREEYEWGDDFVLGGNRERRIGRKLKQAHFCLGFPTIGRQDRQRYALKLADIIMAGNMSSRLFFKLREELGWAYYILPESHLFFDFGFTGVQVGVARDKVNEAIEKVTDEFCNLAETITDKQVEEAKRYWLARSKLTLDSLKFWSSFIGQAYLLDNRLLDLDVEVNEVKKVTSEEIRKVSRKYFDRKTRRLLVLS